jgi:hypothetical protein
VTIHADLSLLGGGDGVAETAAGTPLHPDVVARVACDCSVEVALHDHSGRVVGVGRKSRTPPPWLRRQVVERDRHCRFPGCTNTRFLDVHHLRHWGKGGPTDLDNLGLLCRSHHTLVHKKMLKLELDPSTGAVTCLKPDGTPYANGPPPLRDDIRQRFFGPLVPA